MANLDNPELTEEDFITVILDDNKELECLILTIFEVEGYGDYIALLPTSGKEFEEGEVYIYRYSEDDDEMPVLGNIDSDEEYDAVNQVFEELVSDSEYDEEVGE